jgi:hypothetical protein
MTEHVDWKYDVKISNDNAKNEKRVTIHARSDDDALEELLKKAQQLFIDGQNE